MLKVESTGQLAVQPLKVVEMGDKAIAGIVLEAFTRWLHHQI